MFPDWGQIENKTYRQGSGVEVVTSARHSHFYWFDSFFTTFSEHGNLINSRTPVGVRLSEKFHSENSPPKH